MIGGLLQKNSYTDLIPPWDKSSIKENFSRSQESVDEVCIYSISQLIELVDEASTDPIGKLVDEAKQDLLGWEENWDGEGAPAYQRKTIETAADFLKQLYRFEYLRGTVIRVRILPASEGSIDLYWKEPQFELLINFRPDGSFTCYGDDYHENSIRDKTHPNPESIAHWMKLING